MFLRPPTFRIASRCEKVVQRRGLVVRSSSALPARSILSATARNTQDTRPRSATRPRDVLKRKVALLVGYDGAAYHGLQRNPGVETVSDVLEEALHAAGAISNENVGNLEKIKWRVSARTDRGVSAAGNLISAKLLFRRDEKESGRSFELTTERVNRFLPDTVRLFDIKYVTSSFSARNCCEERWYEYLLPKAALRSPRSLKSFQETMQRYEGSHPFHNFTIGIDHDIPPRDQAQRYITKATCDLETVMLPSTDGLHSNHSEWVRIQVRGQSFMLHQIRKMISLAILTHNEVVPDDAIERSFCRRTLINIPPAPAVGLFLDCCHFGWYNEKHKAALPEPLTFAQCDYTREQFKTAQIFPSIARAAADEEALAIYFRTVEAHPVTFTP